MLKLLKYEILKSKTSLSIGIIVTLCIEALFLLGCVWESASFWGIMLYFLLPAFLAIAVLVYSVNIFNNDISKKQGYMTFLTPHNQFEIIGAKILLSLIITVVAFVAYFALTIGNFYFYGLFYKDDFDIMAKGIYDLIENFGSIENLGTLFIYLLTCLLEYVTTIVSIYLSITLVYTFLSGLKAKGFFAFLAFIVVSTVTTVISALPLKLVDEIDYMNVVFTGDTSLNEYFPVEFFVLQIAINLVLGFGIYFLTAFLAEKKLSV